MMQHDIHKRHWLKANLPSALVYYEVGTVVQEWKSEPEKNKAFFRGDKLQVSYKAANLFWEKTWNVKFHLEEVWFLSMKFGLILMILNDLLHLWSGFQFTDHYQVHTLVIGIIIQRANLLYLVEIFFWADFYPSGRVFSAAKAGFLPVWSGNPVWSITNRRIKQRWAAEVCIFRFQIKMTVKVKCLKEILNIQS